MTTANRNLVTASKLGLVAVAMFGFGYALVPLYDVFCELTGLNGKTGEISAAQAADLGVDTSRLVTVEFDTNVNSRLSWLFTPEQRRMEVHPGQVTEAIFVVTNTSSEQTAGQAVPSVAPSKASLYFDKTECFCFSRQSLNPGESKRMPIRFVVDPKIPGSINMLTLSYTFFPVDDTLAYSGPGATDRKPDS